MRFLIYHFAHLYYGFFRKKAETCRHRWWVYQTALADLTLEVECIRCATLGSVSDPTADEWAQAFTAPSNPYRWHMPQRVEIGKVVDVAVMEANLKRAEEKLRSLKVRD